MDLTLAKLLAMVIQMIILGGFCMMPIWVANYFNRKPWGATFLTCCRTFGGGALMGLYMLHQTPEISFLMSTALPDVDYPVAQIIAGAGFFFFNFLQFTVNYIKRRTEPETLMHEAEIHHEVVIETKVGVNIEMNGQVNQGCDVTNQPSDVIVATGNDVNVNNGNANSTEAQGDLQGDLGNPSLQRITSTSRIIPDDGEEESPVEESTPAPPGGETPVSSAAGSRSIILLIALCFDGFFQGMAIGLQRSNMAVLAVLLGIVSHEFAIAFTLGLELIVTHTKKMHIISALVYGGTPAIGVIIGLIIYLSSTGEDAEEGYLVNGILQSLATGTFLYVIVVGILGRELQNPRLQALVTCLVGYSFLASLAIYHPQYDDNVDGAQHPLPGNFIPKYQMRFHEKYDL